MWCWQHSPKLAACPLPAMLGVVVGDRDPRHGPAFAAGEALAAVVDREPRCRMSSSALSALQPRLPAGCQGAAGWRGGPVSTSPAPLQLASVVGGDRPSLGVGCPTLLRAGTGLAGVKWLLSVCLVAVSLPGAGKGPTCYSQACLPDKPSLHKCHCADFWPVGLPCCVWCSCW